MQQVKDDPAFQAVGSAQLLKAIDAALEGQAYEKPRNWGALFLAFPSNQAWNVPCRGWHIDANYLSALSPPAGVRTHALFGDVAGRAGGTLIVSGSHSKTIRHRPAHAAPIIVSSFKVIPIFVAYTPKAISTNARPVSSAALKSMAASHCKSSRIQARRAT